MIGDESSIAKKSKKKRQHQAVKRDYQNLTFLCHKRLTVKFPVCTKRNTGQYTVRGGFSSDYREIKSLSDNTYD